MDIELAAETLSASLSTRAITGSLREDSETATICSRASLPEPERHSRDRLIPGGELAASMGLDPSWFPEEPMDLRVFTSLLEPDPRWMVLVCILDPVKVRVRWARLMEPPQEGPVAIRDLGTVKLLGNRAFECWCPSRGAWLEVQENTMYNARPPVVLLRESGVIVDASEVFESGTVLGRVEAIGGGDEVSQL
ncbi:hypothetical protein NM688_g1421 [Phlebia brevispora]|uniref:Uncharacterized protein n=1 Tax=Phlebia brevispora TaxID=194682 RepID=A0ACC1TBJ4_9APHY|nr:hypothetical protein NM688_g1421 [Phlebia brevispora]